VLATILATACASTGVSVTVKDRHVSPVSTGPASTGGAPSSTVPSTPTSVPPTNGTAAGGVAMATLPYVDVVPSAVKAIEQFWGEQLPAVYHMAYRTLSAGVHGLQPGLTAPGCDNRTTTYRSVAGNAFYCPNGDFIAYDDTGLFPSLDRRFGPMVVAIVMAHEWGHAIQIRTKSTVDANGDALPTIVLENQADCFAGAWTRWVADGKASNVSITAADVDASISGLLFFRDQLGVTSADQGAHGSGFDRVSAFQDGYEQGVARCARYPQDPPKPLDLTFSQADVATGGNAPYADLVTFIPQALDVYWVHQFQALGRTFAPLDDPAHLRLVDFSVAPPTCAGAPAPKDQLGDGVYFCAADGSLALDQPTVLQAPYDRIGDYAAAIELADGWAKAAVQRAGSTTTGDGRERQLDCLSGAFTGAVYNGQVTDAKGQQISLSPGDLDKAISQFVNSSRAVHGRVFDRVASFRSGFVGGLGACGFPS